MGEVNVAIEEVLPKQGMYFAETCPEFVLCKPKLMALKSVTLEKLDTMQKEAQDQLKATQKAETEAFNTNGSTFSRSAVNLDLYTGPTY